MQIDFNPHKIKAAKAYINNLADDDKKSMRKTLKKGSKDSFFKKILNFLFK